jgi:hypothetical protein
MQITITTGDPDKPGAPGVVTEIIHVLAPTPAEPWIYTDADGDGIAVHTADIDGTPGVYLRTTPNGCAIPMTGLEEFIAAVRDKANEAAHGAGTQCTDTDCGPCSFDRAFLPKNDATKDQP